MERYCFIGRVLNPTERQRFNDFDDESIPMEKTCLRIDTSIPRHTKKHILPPGIYQLECRIGAGNVGAIKKKFQIQLSGDWYDDEINMFEKGVTIKEVL